MSSLPVIATTVVIFIVAALLYFQSHPPEGFRSGPIAGRQYDPNEKEFYMVPADLSKALVAYPSGSIPVPQQRPPTIPGPGSAPREATAQLKDLRELDNKIMLWLDAASQKEREQVGSMTSDQLQSRVMLQARLADVREQLGTGIITDTWRKVADEISALQMENIGWQKISPSLDAVYGFGLHKDPNRFLTKEDYTEFFALLNAGVLELQGIVQPDPTQKVRLQQLQVIRQDLIGTQRNYGIPPIKMSSAQLFLRQMMRADQPLPTIFSVEPHPLRYTLADSPLDILSDLNDIQWKLTVEHDPTSHDLKRSVAAMLDKIRDGTLSPEDARSRLVEMKYQSQATPGQPRANPNPLSQFTGQTMQPVQTIQPGTNPNPLSQFIGQTRQPVANPMAPVAVNPLPHVGHTEDCKCLERNNMVHRATTLCKQIREAFPLDADALGCKRHINDTYEAETVINTVCDRIRYSVPTVSPEQFNCPRKTV